MATGATLITKRIAPQAYDALADALSAVYWNKVPFERHLRLALHAHAELLARLDFNQPKRVVASTVVHLLGTDARYHDTTLQMMLDLAGMTAFPNLAAQPDGARLVNVPPQNVAQAKSVSGFQVFRFL